MAITLDGANKRIILDSTNVSASQIWSAWVDWHGSNTNWPLAFFQTGGNDLGGGLFIPPYFFLLNGWRVRPMEAHQLLIINGNLTVFGGGQPIVQTLGNYNVSVQYTVPVQAQAFSTSGSTGPTAAAVAEAVLTLLNAVTIPVDTKKINGVEIAGDGSTVSPWRAA